MLAVRKLEGRSYLISKIKTQCGYEAGRWKVNVLPPGRPLRLRCFCLEDFIVQVNFELHEKFKQVLEIMVFLNAAESNLVTFMILTMFISPASFYPFIPSLEGI